MRKFVMIAAMMVVASASAQAGGPRSLSLAGSDKAVQETKTAQPVSAVETQRSPLPPQAADASGAIGAGATSSADEKPKYRERPPGIGLSKRDRMKAAAMSQHRAPSRMAGIEMRRPRPRHMFAARIVATLHRYGIYW